MSSRIRIAAGATIYQQHVTYWLDTRSLDGKRRTLGTTDRADAVNRANEILMAIAQELQPPVFQHQKPVALATLADEGTVALASERYSIRSECTTFRRAIRLLAPLVTRTWPCASKPSERQTWQVEGM